MRDYEKRFTLAARRLVRLAVLSASFCALAPLAEAQCLVTISPSTLPNATQGAFYSQTLTATGGRGSYTWSTAGTVPPGLSLGATTGTSVAFSGTPTQIGAFSFTVRVIDPAAPNGCTQGYTISVVAPPLVIASGSPPNGNANVGYSFQFQASGGVPPYHWGLSTGTLPPGLTLSTAGLLSGTPTTIGTSSFTVFVGDNSDRTATGQYTISIQAQPLAIATTSPLPGGTLSVPYSLQFVASGGTTPYTWTVTGALPPGLSLDAASGVLRGTPQQAGTYTFTVQVADATQRFAVQTFQLTTAQALQLTSSNPLPNGSVGASYTFTFAASGGVPPYTWSLSGFLSPGLSLSSTGVLSGIPAQAGAFNITVTVTDSQQKFAAQVFQITIASLQAPQITTSSPLPGGNMGAPYSLTFAAAGGSPPYFWQIDSGVLPQGVKLDGGSGLLSGVPNAAGTFNFVVRATDSVQATSTKQFSLTIGQPSQGLMTSTDSLSFSGFAGGDAPAPQSFSLVTQNPAPLAYTIQIDAGTPGSAAPGWISVRYVKGATPGRIPVSVDQTGLPTGQYTARILATLPDGRQFIVTVTFNVQAHAPQLEVAPDLLRFVGNLQTLGPAEQRLLIRNAGGGGPLGFQGTVSSDSPWLSITPASGQAGPNAIAIVRVIVDARSQSRGARRGVIHISTNAGSADIPVALLVRPPGPAIAVNPNGVRFEARQGNGLTSTRVVNVLDTGDPTVNWQADVLSGGDWLSIGSPAGQATAATPGRLTLQANPGSRGPGAYYALVRVADSHSFGSPAYLTAVLNVLDASAGPVPELLPPGLFFVARAGAQPPPVQPVNIFTSSSIPVAFQASANTSDGGSWLSVDTTSGVTSTQGTAQVNVSVNAAALKPGVYTGDVTVSFSSTLIRTTNVTLVVQPALATFALAAAPDAAGCTPSRMALTQTGTVNSFSSPVGWPAPIVVRVADDCGDPVLNAQVAATFSNGDPALVLRLTNPDTGLYTATWTPQNTAGQMTVTARASSPALGVASVDITGTVAQNRAPTLARNGTINNLNPIKGGALAPGTVVQIFGSGLATSTAQPGVLPLPTIFNGTSVLVGPRNAPLYFVSDGQLNAQLPTELAPDDEYSIVVSAGSAITLPDSIILTPVQAGVAAFSDGRTIAQHQDFSLVTADAPAIAGDVIVLYLVGMGDTDPTVASSQPSPSSPLAQAKVQPVVTVDGKTAQIFFAGLTPGAVGLYQITMAVPPDSRAGNLAVSVTQNGVGANSTLLPVR